MKIIGLEEHCWTPALEAALMKVQGEYKDDSLPLFPYAYPKLKDLGTGRLKDMEAIGVDHMVLSVTTPATQILPPAEAVPLARGANDAMARAVKSYPDRFSAFATLPLSDPKAAVGELQRCVEELGFVGAMIHGRTFEAYPDHADFFPVLQLVEKLNVPIYIHPQMAPRAVRALYYDGFDKAVSTDFAGGGMGWHYEAGVTAIRLILAGVFDKLPGLQIILGHWGEMVAFYLERIDVLSRVSAKLLKKTVANYFRNNFYLTGSGVYSTTYLQRAIDIVGIDRVMYSTDYPFQYRTDGMARTFLEQAPLTIDQKEKIAHGNAEYLLKLG